VIGATVVSLADVQAMSERLGLEIPVLAEVDRALVVDGLGAYPLDRAVDVVSYSSGAIGRIGVERRCGF